MWKIYLPRKIICSGGHQENTETTSYLFIEVEVGENNNWCYEFLKIWHYPSISWVKYSSISKTWLYLIMSMDSEMCFIPNELLCIYQAHVRIWNSVSLQTMHILGLGDFIKHVVCLSFSKAVCTTNSKCEFCSTIWMVLFCHSFTATFIIYFIFQTHIMQPFLGVIIQKMSEIMLNPWYQVNIISLILHNFTDFDIISLILREASCVLF